jgi:hypothetical protein
VQWNGHKPFDLVAEGAAVNRRRGQGSQDLEQFRAVMLECQDQSLEHIRVHSDTRNPVELEDLGLARAATSVDEPVPACVATTTGAVIAGRTGEKLLPA